MTTPVPSSERQPGGDEYLTAPQAARLLKVSTMTVWRWIKAGKLPAVRVGERSVRLKRADLNGVIRPAREGTAVSATPERRPLPVLSGPRGPLSDAEIERALVALAEARAFAGALRQRRGGRPLTPSADVIREAREERSRRL
jgi:excisionase family DNA binding protein